MAISLVSNKELTLQGSGEVTWGISLSDIASKINADVPDNALITKITLKFSGTAYNNASLLYTANDYAVGGLTNSDSDAITNTSGGTGGTNLFKQGPFRVDSKETKNLDNQSIDITKYFAAATPHSVQNTSYSRLTIAFSSQSTYKKIYTFSLSLDVTYEIPTYTVTVDALPAEGGTITGTGSYTRGSQATVTATPSTGYKFTGWANQSGVVTVTTNPYSFTVNNNTTFYAKFERLSYTISTAVTPTGGGTVTGGGSYNHGSSATLVATPATGYKFKCWQDKTSLVNPTRTVTVTGAATYTAVFEKLSYTISVELRGESGLLGDEAATVTGVGTHKYGDTATLKVTPAAGYKFVKWSDGNTDNPRTVTVTENKLYTAELEEIKIPVYVNKVQCRAVYIDENNKTIYFVGDISFPDTADVYDTVDGWHLKSTHTTPTGNGIKAVEKIYIRTTKIYQA
jgi:uncharacterized repeat protein (TIGR02543 family)